MRLGTVKPYLSIEQERRIQAARARAGQPDPTVRYQPFSPVRSSVPISRIYAPVRAAARSISSAVRHYQQPVYRPPPIRPGQFERLTEVRVPTSGPRLSFYDRFWNTINRSTAPSRSTVTMLSSWSRGAR